MKLIRQLIPLGLAEVGRMLDEEVEQPGGEWPTARQMAPRRRIDMDETRARYAWLDSGMRFGCHGAQVSRPGVTRTFSSRPCSGSWIPGCGTVGFSSHASHGLADCTLCA